MKLIAQGKINEAFPTEKTVRLMNDLNKIPLFHLEPVSTKHRNSDKLRFVVDNERNIITLVSDKFVLTQPRETIKQLIQPFITEIDMWRIDYGNGTVIAKFIFNKLLEYENIEFKPGFAVYDSVTKTYKLRICYAPYISACRNELFFTRASFSRKHLGLIKYDLQAFIEKFREWLFNVNLLKYEYQRMQKDVLDKETFENIMKDLKLPEKYTKGIKWCNGYTMWNLYMDLTYKLTRYNAPIQYHIRVSRLTRI